MMLKHVVVSALLLFSACQFSAAQPPDATRLLREVQAKYAAMQTYSDVGEVRSSVTLSGSGDPAEDAGPQQVSAISFKLKLARYQMYSIVWEQNLSGLSQKSALWSDGGYPYLSVLGMRSERKSVEEAFAGATGISGGAAHNIPSVFFDFSGNLVTRMEGVVLNADESVEGEDCYVLKSHSGKIDLTVWISKASKLIRQTRADIAGDLAPPRISDFDLKNTLESFGKTLTDDELREMQAQLENAVKDIKATSTSLIETHRDIKVDEPMSAEDFRNEPPTSTVPDLPQASVLPAR